MNEAEEIKYLQDIVEKEKFSVTFNCLDPHYVQLRKLTDEKLPKEKLDTKAIAAKLSTSVPVERICRFVSSVSEIPEKLDDEVWTPVMKEILANEYILKKLIKEEDILINFAFHSPIAKTMVMITRYTKTGPRPYQIPLSDDLIKLLNPH